MGLDYEDKNNNTNNGLERDNDNTHTNTQTEQFENDGFFGGNNGFMTIGGELNGFNDHVVAMKKLVENKYEITTISEGWKYPIITYSKKVGNKVFYYPTIITDEEKKALSISSFISALQQKDGDAYTLDVMYENNEDEYVKDKLKAIYPSIAEFILVGTSVVRYGEDSYNDINALITRAIEAAPILDAGKDQSLINVNKNFKVTYYDYNNNTRISRNGFMSRADFKLVLSSNINTKISNNSTNKDICSVYGYIDLVPEEQTINNGYNMQPTYLKKLRPIVIITDIVGLSATPGFGIIGMLTSFTMLSRNMYMGNIIKNAHKYADLISVTLGENVNLDKITPADKSAIFNEMVLSPILALDIPNNGYLEELDFMLDSSANTVLRDVITKVVGKQYKSNFIDYTLTLPFIEYFDKHLKDGKDIDCAKIATLSKNISMVLGYARITNDASQDPSKTLVDAAAIINELGIEGDIIGSYGRCFINEDAIKELITLANIRVDYSPIWEAPQEANTFMRRQGYQNGSFYSPNTGYNNNGYRGYKPF